MKRLLISTLCLFFFCMGFCTWALVTLNQILDEAHDCATDVFVSMEQGDVTAAREGLVALATLWDEKADLLEMLCSHDDLHAVKEKIIEAEICISYTDMEDFYGSVSLIGEGIEHIKEQEALKLANLY